MHLTASILCTLEILAVSPRFKITDEYHISVVDISVVATIRVVVEIISVTLMLDVRDGHNATFSHELDGAICVKVGCMLLQQKRFFIAYRSPHSCKKSFRFTISKVKTLKALPRCILNE